MFWVGLLVGFNVCLVIALWIAAHGREKSERERAIGMRYRNGANEP